MNLFPEEDVLTKEIQSWKGFADSLPAEEDRVMFMLLLQYRSLVRYSNDS